MSWFLNILRKFAQLQGEYWIIDGMSEYADGDIGDANHDVIVLQHLAGNLQGTGISEEAEAMCDNCENLNEEQIDDLEENYPGLYYQYRCNYDEYCDFDAVYERAANGSFTPEEMVALQQLWPGYLEFTGQPKDYAVMHLGWIRVMGSNFELQNVTEEALKEIVGHIYEVAPEGNDELEICINEHATQAYECYTSGELETKVKMGQGVADFRRRQALSQQGNFY